MRSLIAGGILFLIPFVLLYIVLTKALSIARSILDPLQKYFPIDSLAGLDEPYILSALFLVFICTLVGTIAKTTLAKKTSLRIEETFLNKLPGYFFLKQIVEEIALGSSTQSYPSVMVRFDDNIQLGFLIESNSELGYSTIFIPGSPNPTSGSAIVVESSRVSVLDTKTTKTMQSLNRLGAGSLDAIKKHL